MLKNKIILFLKYSTIAYIVCIIAMVFLYYWMYFSVANFIFNIGTALYALALVVTLIICIDDGRA